MVVVGMVILESTPRVILQRLDLDRESHSLWMTFLVPETSRVFQFYAQSK